MQKGLYEKIIDSSIAQELADLAVRVERQPLDQADSHTLLSEHLAALIASALRRLPAKNRLEHQRELVNQVIGLLAHSDTALPAGAILPEKLERLLAVLEEGQTSLRPDTPLSVTSLLTGTRVDPSLLSQLKQELATADRVDILCSFIKWGGIGLLKDALEEFTQRRGTRLRVLTTSYMGATDLKAVKVLAALPQTEVKVSYDVHRTRLHAKAYLFERRTGFSAAYIGSANLSRPALTEGLEWTVKVTEYADRPIWEKVLATFETYWQDAEFEPFEEDRLRLALDKESGHGAAGPALPVFELRPYQFQEEVLESLVSDRAGHAPPHRQLVVAATGTGKTMIAAFDYRRVVAEQGGRYPALLVVAHRREILQQTLHTFRAVLRDQNFGALLDGSNDPGDVRHLFATVQTLHRRQLPLKWREDAFEYVLIDETHRSAASSYQGVLDFLKPNILLGLTATPERADGEDICKYFGDRIVSEIRLPDAINRRLVVPFHYYGVADAADMDLSTLTWARGGYRISDIDRLVTGNHVRAQLVVDQCRKRLMDVCLARGLGFCVSVAHAEFMADFFTRAGIPAQALSAESALSVRDSARQRLRRREINFLFVVDLYNEGVDIPEIDAVLFLRPTESLTVFLQQLGRGLRLTEEKDYLTVLDFVGKMHRKFRFDLRLKALSMHPEADVRSELENDFPYLPAGCAIQIERVARERILENIKQSLLAGASALIRNIADFSTDTGKDLTLAAFLDHYRLSPNDIYRRDTWTALCARAKLRDEPVSPDNAVLAKWLRRISHADDEVRLTRWQEWLKTGRGDDPFVHALLVPFMSKAITRVDPQEIWERLNRSPDILVEARELVDWLLLRPGVVRHKVEPIRTLLVPHASYTRDEVLVLTGAWNWQEQKPMREGVRYLPEQKLDLFLATIQKSEKHYSPSTLYEDYAISGGRFHWQSQSTTSESSPTGQRYINHQKMGCTPLLFVRSIAKVGGYAQPYFYMGPVQYESHEGGAPMSITWKMRVLIPARLLREFQTLAVA
jgi:superfamily II DNA or RNA helicase